MGKASRTKRERRSDRTERVLYHFTSAYHLPLIERDGFIRTTESNVSFRTEHAGPDVVWLMDTPTAEGASHGLAGSAVDKKAVCITVKVRAERWTDWFKRQPNATPEAYQILVRTGGGPSAAAHWYVTEQPIPRERWVKVEARLGVDA